MNNIMLKAIKQANKAYIIGDVPVGAVILKDNKIISKAYNKKEKQKNAIKHAEIIAIEKACKKLKTWHLDGCEIYTTMEPCLMCFGAIEQSRIKKIVYGVKNDNFGFSSKYNIKTKIFIENVTMPPEYIDLIKLFFKNIR